MKKTLLSMAVLAASGAAFAQVAGSTRRIEDNGTKSAGLNIDDGHLKTAAPVGTTVAADAGVKAEAADNAEKPAAQMQQSADTLVQADAKPSTTAQAPQQQQTWPQVRCLSKSLV